MNGSPLGPVVHYLHRVAGGAGGCETDGQLLRRFLDRADDSAFAALLERHGAMVLGVCRRVLRNCHDAEDAFQATFLVLARKASSVRKSASLSSWLYGVAYRTALKARCRSSARRSREVLVGAVPEAPGGEPIAGGLSPALDEELSRLPEKYRLPLVLCYLQGLTYDEAARRLGWTRGTVSGRLARARDLLRDRLTRRGLTLTGAAFAAALADAGAAGLPAALASATLQSVTVTLSQAAAPGAAAAVTLAEGVLHAMWMTKLKAVGLVLLGLAVVGTAAVSTYPATGQGAAARSGADQDGQSAGKKKRAERLQEELQRLRAENERLRAELEVARRQLERTLAELQLLKAGAANREAALELQAERAAKEAAAQRAAAEDQQQKARSAVQSLREAAARARSANNLKQIGLAFHNYHDQHGHFPPSAIYDKNGKALLSWRVALLPYLEQGPLYEKFKLDEPWDSPHNKKLLAEMPKVYAPVMGKDDGTATYYQVFTGPKTLFDGTTGAKVQNIRDGLSITLLALEAGDPVPWTRPADLEYDPDGKLPRLGGLFPDGMTILIADGSVRFVTNRPDAAAFRSLILPSDGRLVSPDDLNR